MSDGSEPNRQRLGQLVLARRKELGLSVREAARRAGVMRPTWTGLEQGSRRTADYNFAAMERTLNWRPGSFESVLAGREPTPLERTRVAGGEPAAPPPAIRPRADEPRRPSTVRWSEIVEVLDAHLGGIGQATAVGGTQRLWGAEQITTLARRLRPHQVTENTGAVVVAWSDVVAGLEATIAAIRQDASMTSEARLWGIEMVVDIAGGLRAARRAAADDDLPDTTGP